MKLTTAICCLAALVIPGVAAHAQKPIREGVTSVLYKEPPSTLSALFAASDSVVVVRVSSTRGVESVQQGGSVLTEVTGTIVEVVKPNSQVGPVGSNLMFRIHGGEIDRGDYIERVLDKRQPRLLSGKEYVVALTWSRSENAFFPAFGPGSIFETIGDTVTPQRHTALAENTKGLSRHQFIAEMKKSNLPVK
jgi:hypothetical protein